MEKLKECEHNETRYLECDEHGKECPLVVCVDCGVTTN